MATDAPLYIVSKGRAKIGTTTRVLTSMHCPHHVVVEPQEVEEYARELHGSLATVIPLDMTYKAKYELLDGHGLTKSTGPGPARNFVWDHSIGRGYRWHWVMDDNIVLFSMLRRSKRRQCRVPEFWNAMTRWADQYRNLAMAGPNYEMFAPDIDHRKPPVVFNTRIYSCNLIRNDVPFRWRGRYNEDTILSIDMLKAGWCTAQFNVFLQAKLNTQVLPGGNTQEFYAKEGTRPKSEMLVKVHGDCARLNDRFGRVHHHVDYSRFAGNLLVKRPGAKPPDIRFKLVRNDQPAQA